MMVLYGITIVSSEGDILITRDDGTKEWVESLTKISTDKQECIDYAIVEMKKSFAAYDFEDGKDESGCTEEKFEAELKSGNNICIKACSSHICFEFFEQEVKGWYVED